MTDVATQVPATIDYAADAGEGLEYTDSKCFRIPFLQMLQGQSPALDTVEGARPGKFWNNVTNELFDKVVVVPCMFQRVYNRWAPRKDGGGFKGVFDAVKVDEKDIPNLTMLGNSVFIDVPEGKTPLDDQGKPQCDELVDTRNHYVLYHSVLDAQWHPALVSFKSSGIKKSRNWVTIMDGIKVATPEGPKTPATYSRTYELGATKEENAEGAWWNVEAKMMGPTTDHSLYNTAKAFAKQIKAGMVEAVPTTDAA